MFGDGSLTFHEFAMREPLPLAMIQDAVLEFLRGRTDAVLFGSHAVNAYVKEARMTQDVDILSTRGRELAEELQAFLTERFHMAVRVRAIRGGVGYRLYQVRKPANRHLVDIRPVAAFPPHKRIKKVLVVTPPELVAAKVSAWVRRQGKPKSGTDWRDLAHLLLTFPDLKRVDGLVRERLQAMDAGADVLAAWEKIVQQHIEAESDEDEFDF